MNEDEYERQLPLSNSALFRIEQQMDKLTKEELALRSRDWKHYENLRKTDLHHYLTPKIQVQMMKDAIALGQDFGMPEFKS